jgi:hypothetical protein
MNQETTLRILTWLVISLDIVLSIAIYQLIKRCKKSSNTL